MQPTGALLSRRYRPIWILAILGILGQLIAVPSNATAAPAPLAAETVAAMWNAYGDQGGHWTGADSTASVPLPDGRIAWLFSDTFLGTVNADHSRPQGTPMVNNTLVVQSGAALGPTLHGGTATEPKALVQAVSPDEFYWVGDGMVADGALKAFYHRYRRNSTAVLDVTLLGTSLVTFRLPELTITSVQQLQLGARVAWGNAILQDAGYTYIYGTEHAQNESALKFLHVARQGAGSTAAWEFWTGTGWSPTESLSARVISGVGAFSVDRIGDSYVLVTQDTDIGFSRSVVARIATGPQGPFGAAQYLFDAPEPTPGSGRYIYDARTHPELAAPGKLLISYNLNTFREADLYADARIYRPRFVDVAWPPSEPDPSTLPGKPAALTIDGNGDPIRLRWTAPSSGATGYRVYKRDVTGGQTHFARLGGIVTGTSVEEGFLLDGHTYEFQVTAVNASGEGPPSNISTVAISVAAPPAPTGLSATVGGAGDITVTWAPVSAPARYALFLRDVTAEQSEFAPVMIDDTFGTTGTARKLMHNHVYEFVVTALNGGGESVRSAPVRATARYDLPGVPTQLHGAANADGSASLDWTAPGPDLWYWIYQRNVTAGESGFSRLAYPVTQGVTARPGGLIDGHEYEFKVSAVNAGGEGPAGAAVRVTARFDKPLAPTGLRATANADGTVSLDWKAPGPDLWYWVYQRDVTAGETSSTRLEYPVSQGNSARPGGLITGNTYEFAVSAINAAGEGPRSTPVQATARYDKPPAPAGLTATAGNGEVQLSWNPAGPDCWYWVYYRDTTKGDQGFTRSAYPVITGSSASMGLLINGHVYEFKVTAVNGGGEGPASTTVTAKPMPPLPGRVSGLTATPDTAGAITLRWDPLAPDVFYWIYQRDITAGETTPTKLAYPTTTTSFVFTGLKQNHEYELTVAAENLSGTGPQASAVRAVAHYDLPAAPTGLTGRSAGDGSIALTWDGPAPNLMYWVYYRDVTAGQTGFTRAAWPATSTSASLGSLVHGHEYEFKVSAVNAAGEGPTSGTIRVTSVGGLPAPPSGLAATAGDSKVVLAWTASPTPSVMYWVYYRDSATGEAWHRLQYPITDTTLTVSPLTNGHYYEFQVTAVNASGDSPPTATVTARPTPPVPAAPTGLGAIAGHGEVGLGWQMTPGAEMYNVYYRDTTVGQSGWYKLPYPVREWWLTVRPLADGHRYEFYVTAVNMSGESGPSGIVAATPVPPAPEAPSGLTAVAGNGQVSLSWNASPTPDVYYWVYYRPQGHTSWYYLPAPTTSTSYLVKPLFNGFTYEFKVTAANLGGQSGYSNTVSARPFQPPPLAPSGLTAVAGDGQVSLSWNPSPTPGVFYWVYYRPEGQSGWYYFQQPVSGTHFTARPLLNGFNVEFKVTAANGGGQSGFSNTVTAKPFLPLPAPPTGLTGADGEEEVFLSWNASPTPNVYYWVYFKRSTSDVWYYHPVPILGTTARLSGLAGDHLYDIKVTAANAAGQSVYSNIYYAWVRAKPPVAPHLSGVAFPGKAELSWSCVTDLSTAMWVEERVQGTSIWNRFPYPVMRTGSACFHYVDTQFWTNNVVHEYRLVAERYGRTAPTNIVSARVRETVNQAYLRLTAPTEASYNDFYYARDHQYLWVDYRFDWTNDGCTVAPNYPYGFPFVFGCIRHDFGYGNHRWAGSDDRYRIDDSQHQDHRRVCSRQNFLVQGFCYGVAREYFIGVRAFGGGHW